LVTTTALYCSTPFTLTEIRYDDTLSRPAVRTPMSNDGIAKLGRPKEPELGIEMAPPEPAGEPVEPLAQAARITANGSRSRPAGRILVMAWVPPLSPVRACRHAR
jgi:hypothetical protein